MAKTKKSLLSDQTKALLHDYLRSSIVTFLTGFVLVLAPHISQIDFNTLESAGLTGAWLLISRLVVRAAWQGFVLAFTSLGDRLGSRG